MSRDSDSNRILRLLREAEGLSNLSIRTQLNLSDTRYASVKEELLDTGLIERYVCRGGGIRLTRKGERESSSDNEVQSGVEREANLYDPLVGFLEKQAEEDGLSAVICPTHPLKARGQWQNPDVTKIAIEYYRNLRKTKVTVTTFEVKQFGRWGIDVVYEAASHHRFSHESYVVLEWPNSIEFSLTDASYKIDQIARECQRFGVGLQTLQQYYSSYRLYPRLAANPSLPDDENVDAWLDYVFSRNSDLAKTYKERFDSVLNMPNFNG